MSIDLEHGPQQLWSEGGEEHWTEKKEGVRLFLWRKPPAEGAPVRGVIVWVHGSSMASQPMFDLQVPGRPDASVMEWFAQRGFDCWTFDSEGYGRSDKHRQLNADIATGAEDTAAVVDYVTKATRAHAVHLYGVSSGALKAAMYASFQPDRVRRLALEAFVWTGDGSPTLAERRKRVAEWAANLRRPQSAQAIRRIFTRDKDGLADQETIEAFTKAVLALDDTIPNGTYLDMCTKLPCVDPALIRMPTLVLRGEHDGIATDEDVARFFHCLPCKDKQLSLLADVGHGGLLGRRAQVVKHVLLGFLTQPS